MTATKSVDWRGVEALAKEAAGNWQTFDSFVWHNRGHIPQPERCAIVYTGNRDSGLLTESNAGQIAKRMARFTRGLFPTAWPERHSHWAAGHVDGFVIRVYVRNGKGITQAFREWCKIQEELASHPVLDESDWSAREYAATIENIEEAAYSLKREYDLPEAWPAAVFSWLWQSEEHSSELEPVDDQGGYPSEECLRAAFDALGYGKAAA